MHESLSSFEGLALDVLCRLWEEMAEVKKLILADAHEVDIWDMINGLTLLSCMLCRQRLIHQIGLQFIQNLEVTEVCKFGQIQYCFVFGDFIVLVVEHLDDALSNKEHLLDWAFVTDYHAILLEDSAKH